MKNFSKNYGLNSIPLPLISNKTPYLEKSSKKGYNKAHSFTWGLLCYNE